MYSICDQRLLKKITENHELVSIYRNFCTRPLGKMMLIIPFRKSVKQKHFCVYSGSKLWNTIPKGLSSRPYRTFTK